MPKLEHRDDYNESGELDEDENPDIYEVGDPPPLTTGEDGHIRPSGENPLEYGLNLLGESARGERLSVSTIDPKAYFGKQRR